MVDATLAVTFNCLDSGGYKGTVENYGLVQISMDVRGTPQGYAAGDTTITMAMAVSGAGHASTIANRSVDWAFSLPMQIGASAAGGAPAAFANRQCRNWVAWSKIGDVSFEQDLVNDAGARPMAWRGYVYQVKQLGSSAIVYGSDGITMMYPVDEPAPTFGFKELGHLGLIGKMAVAGDNQVHFFIDRSGVLWRLTKEGLERLGYREFLSGLTNPVMFYSSYHRKLYISSAAQGYILNEGTLGGGYANAVDLVDIDGTSYLVSPGNIPATAPEIVTDELDFGSRARKDIESLEIGSDSGQDLYVALDYRYSKESTFNTSSWVRVNDEGYARIKVAAVDFRIRIKSLTLNAIEIHYILVTVKYADRRFNRGGRYANSASA